MNNVYWFNFVSHDLRLLPIQIDHFDKHCQDNVHALAVQGPFGANLIAASGTYRITKPGARKMGISLINVPDIFAGLLMPNRFKQIADWVWSRFIRVSDDIKFAILTHGDIIPTKDFDIESILDGKPIAGVFEINADGDPITSLPYLAVDVEQCRPHGSLRLGKASGRVIDKEPYWIDLPFKNYGTSSDIKTNAKDFFDKYQGPVEWEWCEPCFLHLTKLAHLVGRRAFQNSYDAMIKSISEVDPLKFCYQTGSNQIHRIRKNKYKLNCKHRGNKVIKQVPCSTCGRPGKTVPLKVYSCAEFGLCTIGNDIGEKVCSDCDSYDEG